jgi:D-tyrosyl-tRNA(Tyr) deacylase
VLPPLGYLVVLSEEDPVATAVGVELGTPAALSHLPDGTPIRSLGPGVGLLRRPGLHVHDDGVDRFLPAQEGGGPTLVFPSVHRSAHSRETLTVHPLGNPGASAEVGGAPWTLVPSDPRRMTDAYRRVADLADSMGWPASFEATHHGPRLDRPAFFVEIGAADYAHPPPGTVRGFARLLGELTPDPRDRIVLGLGGGHYAPHFSELARRRRWAFGHLLPDHALVANPARIVEAAWSATPGVEGVLYHRARDAEGVPWGDRWPRRRDAEAEPRIEPASSS